MCALTGRARDGEIEGTPHPLLQPLLPVVGPCWHRAKSEYRFFPVHAAGRRVKAFWVRSESRFCLTFIMLSLRSLFLVLYCISVLLIVHYMPHYI